MRDLHLGFEEIGNMTYPQVYIFMKCLREVNIAKKSEYDQQMAKMQLRGKLGR